MIKNNFFFVFLFTSVVLFSQENYSKEISLVSDNDLYTSAYKDKYYTNGTFLSYRYLTSNKSNKTNKRIIEWQVAHKMYTPYSPFLIASSLHDRPFAAYLYGSYAVNRVYKNNSIFTSAIELGTIGPSAKGQELQKLIHDIYGFKDAIGWKYQIKDAFGINLKATFVRPIKTNYSNRFDFNWFNNLNLGTVFTDISTGFYSRIGFKPLQQLANSIAFNTNLNSKDSKFNNKPESFLYLKSTLNYAIYDATVQGSFLNNTSPVTKELIPLTFNVDFGIRFTANRFNFGYALRYDTNKIKNLRYKNGNVYGTISINYLIP